MKIVRLTEGFFGGTLSLRPVSGFSLVTVAALGSVTMLWLFAMAAAVVPTYQKASQTRYLTIVRSSAEAGLDFTVDQLSKALKAQTTSPLDDSSPDGVPRVTSLPASAVGNALAAVTVRVNNVAPPPTSSVYDAQLVGSSNQWRVVEATASYAGLSKTIRVVLQPQVGESQIPGTEPYFKYSMFGNAYVKMSGNAWTDGYNSAAGPYGGANVDPKGGDVGTNATHPSDLTPWAVLSSNARVGGDLHVRRQPPSTNPLRPVASRAGNAVVEKEAVINGYGSGGFDGDGSAPADNVLGVYPRPAPPYNAYKPNENLPKLSFPAAESAPPTSYDSGQISVFGNGNIVVDPAASRPAGAISVSGNSTRRIPPGDYRVSKFSTAGTGKIEILPTVTTPVRVFVEGNVAGADAISITGNGIVNRTDKPSMMQFWYNGSKNIRLAGNTNLYATVYAPNATVFIAGNGNHFGAITANAIENSSNGAVHYDQALANQSANPGLFFAPQSSARFEILRTISWQEL